MNQDKVQCGHICCCCCDIFTYCKFSRWSLCAGKYKIAINMWTSTLGPIFSYIFSYAPPSPTNTQYYVYTVLGALLAKFECLQLEASPRADNLIRLTLIMSIHCFISQALFLYQLKLITIFFFLELPMLMGELLICCPKNNLYLVNT